MEIKITKYTVTQHLKDAILSSEMLLIYAAEQGLDIEKEQVKIITDAKEGFENETWTKEIEVEFWLVYKNLSKLVKPVSVDSLRASQETEIKQPNILQKIFGKKRRNTITHKSVRFYTFFAIISMLMLLIIQIYFSIGTIRLNSIEASNTRLEEIEKRLGELMLIIGKDETDKSAAFERETLENELFKLDQEKSTNIKILGSWLAVIKNIISFDNDKNPKVTDESNSQNFALMAMDDSIETIQESQNFVLMIGFYILPLFFGLLGAITYVLRDLVVQIKQMMFSKETNVNYTLRIILGTLAGLAVGLLWGDIKQQEQFTFFESLGPLAAAFLAGLLVEYLFSGIERWVSNLVSKGTTETKK